MKRILPVPPNNPVFIEPQRVTRVLPLLFQAPFTFISSSRNMISGIVMTVFCIKQLIGYAITFCNMKLKAMLLIGWNYSGGQEDSRAEPVPFHRPSSLMDIGEALEAMSTGGV